MFKFSFVCPFLSPSVQFLRCFFFPWFDCSPVRAFVPSYVSSSDRSFPGAVVRLPSRSIVPSFDLSCDDSFVGLNVRPPVRSYLCLSFRWFLRTSFCLIFLSSVLFFHVLFYFVGFFFFPSPYLSFLGSIVRPPVRSFLRTFLRPIDRSLVRSFVCPPVGSCLRSIFRAMIRLLVQTFVCPFDRTFVCLFVGSLGLAFV